MQKRQTLQLKITLVILVLLASFSVRAQMEDLNESLHIADSLFDVQKYTQSFEIYQAIHEKSKMSSPAMLLKMAFIREALDDIPNSLYYLNLYYLRTSDERVLEKMDELATKHGLQGYDYTQADFFLNVYYEYYNELTFGLVVISLLIFAGILYRRYRFKVRPYGLAFLFLIFSAGVIYSLNFGRDFRQGIIEEQNTYLMSEPSSSSRVIAIVDQGHRVKIRGIRDVWYEVEWNDEKAYVKGSHIQPIYRQ